MAKLGPKYKDVKKDDFEKLCALQCTLEEISDFFSVSPDTIERWCKRTYKKRFEEVFAAKRCKGKISLRRMQWKLAESNVAMAIFLGKNYLGQSDKVEYADTTAINRLDEILAGVKEKAKAKAEEKIPAVVVDGTEEGDIVQA